MHDHIDVPITGMMDAKQLLKALSKEAQGNIIYERERYFVVMEPYIIIDELTGNPAIRMEMKEVERKDALGIDE